MALRANGRVYLSWDDIETLIDKLCEKVIRSGAQVSTITGLKRGGLIPAVIISHKLNIPYVESIGHSTLVIDDICDTGETLNKLITPFTAVLHYKRIATHIPKFFAQEVGNEWIVYPWEGRDSEAIQDYLKK